MPISILLSISYILVSAFFQFYSGLDKIGQSSHELLKILTLSLSCCDGTYLLRDFFFYQSSEPPLNMKPSHCCAMSISQDIF